MESAFKIGGVFDVECFGPDGNLKWKDTAKNLVPDAGLNHILDVVLHGTTPVSPWYVGLTDGTPTAAAGDTIASHAGWVEVTAYTGNRQEYVEAAASGKSTTNSASKASFPITADSTTVGGAFLFEAATGTTGVLLCVAAFTGGDKACDNGDTLSVTYTMSAADA